MGKILSKKEAIEFIGIDDKTFDNYFKTAKEFKCLPRQSGRGRFLFDQDALNFWIKEHKWRTVSLNSEDYALCLDFALAQHFRGYVLSDWGSSRQREFGQKITNWVKGQLGEVAVKKFFEKEFGVKVELDFQIYQGEIVPQDITGIIENKKMRDPKIGIGIKTSKPKSAFLILSENEVELKARRSDVYIFCRPDLPDDHLLRITNERIAEIVEGQQHFHLYKDDIPKFTDIPCEIAGWCQAGELEKRDTKQIPGLENAKEGYRYVKESGYLHRDKKSWENLLDKL